VNTTASLKRLAELDLEIKGARIALARKTANAFIPYALRDPSSKNYFTQAPLHVGWHKAIDEYPWNLIEAPREHGKSEQVVIGRTLYELGRDSSLRIKIVGSVDDEASKRVMALADHIENNERVHDVFPNLLPDKKSSWNNHQLTVKRNIPGIKDASIEGYGILSSSTGGRADWIIFDDVVDFDNTLKNPALIEKVADAFYNKWLNQLTERGRVTYIFTRWHQRDLSHRLIAQAQADNIQTTTREKFKYTVDLIDPTLNSICHFWPHDRLQSRLEAIGARAFGRGFQGKAMTDDEAIFNCMQRCVDVRLSPNDIPAEWENVGGVDLGIGKKSQNARSVIFTLAIAPDGRIYWRDIQAGRWSSPETAERLEASFKRFNHKIIFVENNAYQQAILDWIRYMPSSNGVKYVIRPFHTGGNKVDPEIGLPSVAVRAENGQIVIPHGHAPYTAGCKCSICDALNEFLFYPIAEQDDCVMAHWFAIESTRRKVAIL
jgi:hypothetical protein